MNDIDLCLEVVSRSCQPLRYIRRYLGNVRSCEAVRSAILATAWLLVFVVLEFGVRVCSSGMLASRQSPVREFEARNSLGTFSIYCVKLALQYVVFGVYWHNNNGNVNEK